MNTAEKTEQLSHYLQSRELERCCSILNNATAEDLLDLQFLTRANDVQRASGNINQALHYAKRLKHIYPKQPVGHVRTAQDHLALRNNSEARQTIEEALHLFPNHPRVLTAANQISRSFQDHESALRHALKLCTQEPSNPVGFNRASQDLLALGRAQEAKELMCQFQASNPKSPEALKQIRLFYRLLGQRKQALEISRQIRQLEAQGQETVVEECSDLIATQQIEEALEQAIAHNLCSQQEASNIAKALGSIQAQERITPQLRAALNQLKIYPQLQNHSFNKGARDIQTSKSKLILCIVHVGKCAGESVIKSLDAALPKKGVEIVEFHTFDANEHIREAIQETLSNPTIHWIILTRDPIKRWISSFNWDYHTFGLNQYFYCHPRVNQHFAQYRTCRALIDGLMRNEENAIALSRMHHLAYGHMAMGQSWYLSKNAIDQLNPKRTSIIRTEHIQSDFEHCLRKLSRQAPELKIRMATRVIQSKNNYQSWYEAESFTKEKELTEQERTFLKKHLQADYRLHKRLIKRFRPSKRFRWVSALLWR